MLVNRVGLGVGGAHSGMTAEGDNSVLMQKVVKDILAHTQEGLHVLPPVSEAAKAHLATTNDITEFVALKNLIYLKEGVEIQHMTAKVQDLVLEQGKKFFEVWTTLVSDDILGLAHAVGERFML